MHLSREGLSRTSAADVCEGYSKLCSVNFRAKFIYGIVIIYSDQNPNIILKRFSFWFLEAKNSQDQPWCLDGERRWAKQAAERAALKMLPSWETATLHDVFWEEDRRGEPPTRPAPIALPLPCHCFEEVKGRHFQHYAYLKAPHCTQGTFSPAKCSQHIMRMAKQCPEHLQVALARSLNAYRVVWMRQGSGFNSWSGHTQESANERINKWNNRSVSLSLSLSLSLSNQ